MSSYRAHKENDFTETTVSTASKSSKGIIHNVLIDQILEREREKMVEKLNRAKNKKNIEKIIILCEKRSSSVKNIFLENKCYPRRNIHKNS